jgi:putative Mg2+ transporter-C (MgtC) family protein
MHDELITVIRLLLAGVLGGLIGFQREKIGKVAGIRTLALISIGACLFASLSLLGFSPTNNQLVANVVVGVGFLGTGAIIHREQGVIEGMTTAATIWVSAAIGVAAGIGFYFSAIGATAIVFVVLLLPHVHNNQGSKKE